ncbi:RodZ domain-containing protein [Pseudomonas borbori]
MKAAPPEVATAPRVNPGESLRKARESKGWTVAEVAGQLNLTVQRLGQIEAGAFDKLPGHTFARGYIRTYAKLLGMDQNRLVMEFDQLTGSDAAGSSVHSLGRIEEPVRYSQGILRFVSFILLLALAGIGFYWWQGQSSNQAQQSATSIGHVEVEGADGATQIHVLDEPEDQAVADAQVGTELNLPSVSAEVAAQPQPAAPAPGDESAPLEPGIVQTPAGEPAATAESTPSTPEAAVDAGETDAAASSADMPAEPAVAEAAPVLAAGEGLVAVQFTADCWVQLRDASNKVVFSGLKREGENLRLVGKAPLELRLGFARGAQVSYNGEPVNVAPFVTGETARIKLGGQ